MSWKFLLFLFAGALAWATALSQAGAQKLVRITQYCVFDGSKMGAEIYQFASDSEAERALRLVMDATGLKPNFVIGAANVPNAVATIIDNTRVILYNQDFMHRIRLATNTDWSAISILAHEVGHHLQGHTLLPGGSRPEFELEADQYSGFVLRRLGAGLEQAQVAIRLIASDRGSDTHPARDARLAAITNGWMKAREDDNRRGNDRSGPVARTDVEECVVDDTRPPDDYLALRTAPSSAYGQRVAVVRNGTRVDVLERRPDGWWRVRVQGGGNPVTEGWALNGQFVQGVRRQWIHCRTASR